MEKLTLKYLRICPDRRMCFYSIASSTPHAHPGNPNAILNGDSEGNALFFYKYVLLSNNKNTLRRPFSSNQYIMITINSVSFYFEQVISCTYFFSRST